MIEISAEWLLGSIATIVGALTGAIIFLFKYIIRDCKRNAALFEQSINQLTQANMDNTKKLIEAITQLRRAYRKLQRTGL